MTDLDSPSVADLAQAIAEKHEKGTAGDTPCYLCGDDITKLGGKLAFFPIDTGLELVHKRCIEALKREGKKKHAAH